ncbi:MAG: hypothetical protein JJU16_01240 [Alkalibacterium sp.]|nr:hypothetical protein [Alkalibacterium sp.]
MKFASKELIGEGVRIVLYKITIRKKNNEYQITIPPRIVEMLKESEEDRLIKEHTHQIKVKGINIDGDRTDAFTESVIEGMNKYHDALKNLVNR